MRIGISVLTHEGQNIWENGLGQNVLFLVRSLQALPFVQRVVLLDSGDQSRLPPQVDAASIGDLALLKPADATELLDVVIELSGGLEVSWLDRMRARGAKVVWYVAGQPYVGLVEPQVFGKGGYFTRADRCDQIWLLEKDRASVPMLRTLHRCPVEIAPYLWAPNFLESRIGEVNSSGAGAFGWQQPVQRGWRVAVMEPNISVVKSCSIPMLVCDVAYRQDKSAIDQMVVLNSLHMAQHATMLNLANSLDIVKEHKALFDGRHDVAGFLATRADAVVSHQWCNDQNYLYLDALYGGYPLIHNSPWLRDAGYYYPDFEATQGAAMLMKAIREHGATIDDYRATARRVFDRVDPLAPANLTAHAKLLLGLWGGSLPERLKS